MKTKKYTPFAFIFLATAALTFNSCKKDKDTNPPAPEASNGTLGFHMHNNVDTVEVEDYDSVNVMSNGRKITVSMGQLYLSNIQMIKLDGSTVDVSGVIALKREEEEVYQLGSVPSGNYKSVKFNVGLSPTVNASSPAASNTTLNQPPMWFGATAQPSGFVFVNFQGTIDTTTAGNGTILYPFSYKIGTNTNLKTVTMPDQNFTISPDQIEYVHLTIDYNKLFNGIQLNVNSNLHMDTPADNATPLGTQISNNVPSMFSYEME